MNQKREFVTYNNHTLDVIDDGFIIDYIAQRIDEDILETSYYNSSSRRPAPTYNRLTQETFQKICNSNNYIVWFSVNECEEDRIKEFKDLNRALECINAINDEGLDVAHGDFIYLFKNGTQIELERPKIIIKK